MKKTSCKGPLYKHLGHFAKDKYLSQGHNDSSWPKSDSDYKVKIPDIDEARARRERHQEYDREWADKTSPFERAMAHKTIDQGVDEEKAAADLNPDEA